MTEIYNIAPLQNTAFPRKENPYIRDYDYTELKLISDAN